MRKFRSKGMILLVFIAGMLFGGIPVYAQNVDVNFERDYVKRIYDSANGLDGSSTNCIYAANNGMLWIGGYSGLFRYDGIEFERIDIDGRSISVKTIIQDQEGVLWIGTNDEGVYCYDGREFVPCKIKSDDERADSINKFCLDHNGNLWIGTKAGLFLVDMSQEEKSAIGIGNLKGREVRDIAALASGDNVVVTKKGEVFFVNKMKILPLNFHEFCEGEKIRCCGVTEGDVFFLGTDGNKILKVSNSGKVLRVIDGKSLSCINAIREQEQGNLWICSDTGIGILKNDQLNVLQMPLDDSIEDVCRDYQGGFWFASSRQGIMQIYQNDFSDFGTYLNNHETVNTIQIYFGKMYVGTDQGLYCYADKEQIEDDALVKACLGQRIRQLYIDSEENLWAATYQSGLLEYHKKDGTIKKYNANNSGLSNDQIRCIVQDSNHEMLVGTERGIFMIRTDHSVEPFVQDSNLKDRRIMDIAEDEEGKIYVATDSDGIYVIANRKCVRRYMEKDGLPSSSVMRLIPSKQMHGIWIITGQGLCFLDAYGKILRITGIPYSNCLDLIVTENEEAIILAGNGLFRLKEKEMLESENPSYEHWNRKMGLPIDFTANARNVVKDGAVYLCGADGFASMNLKQEKEKKNIRLYVNSITADGREVYTQGEETILSADVQRIHIDVRILHYICQNVTVTAYLEGLEEHPSILYDCENTQQSYNNLNGGQYIYHVQVKDTHTQECLQELSVPITKNFHFWEIPRVQYLMGICVLLVLGLCIFLIALYRMKKFERNCEIKFLQEKNEVVSRMAYRDLVTNTYNRNLFEEDMQQMGAEKIDVAVVIVGVNFWDYLRRKYGNRQTNNILIKLVHLIRESSQEELRIYRCTESVFVFWFTKSVDLDRYIQNLKQEFAVQIGEGRLEFSISVGAAYRDPGVEETLDDLIDRCERMRIMDEKNAEFSFVESKIHQLS